MMRMFPAFKGFVSWRYPIRTKRIVILEKMPDYKSIEASEHCQKYRTNRWTANFSELIKLFFIHFKIYRTLANYFPINVHSCIQQLPARYHIWIYPNKFSIKREFVAIFFDSIQSSLQGLLHRHKCYQMKKSWYFFHKNWIVKNIDIFESSKKISSLYNNYFTTSSMKSYDIREILKN